MKQEPADRQLSKAQRIFLDASKELREYLKTVLQEEREVQHLRRRSDIHQRLYEHVRRLIR